jgi:hypothetical protein
MSLGVLRFVMRVGWVWDVGRGLWDGVVRGVTRGGLAGLFGFIGRGE